MPNSAANNKNCVKLQATSCKRQRRAPVQQGLHLRSGQHGVLRRKERVPDHRADASKKLFLAGNHCSTTHRHVFMRSKATLCHSLAIGDKAAKQTQQCTAHQERVMLEATAGIWTPAVTNTVHLQTGLVLHLLSSCHRELHTEDLAWQLATVVCVHLRTMAKKSLTSSAVDAVQKLSDCVPDHKITNIAPASQSLLNSSRPESFVTETLNICAHVHVCACVSG